jgi:putative DNA primase/helicase
LLAPFTQFPFVKEENGAKSCKAVFVAAILTAIQRRLLGPCPLFGFSAPAQRSGKSLLAESVAQIATGKPAPATSVSRDPEELRKAITSILREGHAIANLDNIIHPLGSPFLAAAITQGEYGDRLLGENRNLNLPTTVTWTATGNNLSFRSGLTSRALLCRIDSGEEKPEERKFDIKDLPAHLHENRVRLVVAALTVLKAFHAAGKPGAE